MLANTKQVGGGHYKVATLGGGEEHWDRVARLGLDYFQACATKYIERAWRKNGLEDIKKAHHFLEKYIEQIESDRDYELRKTWRESGNFQPGQEIAQQAWVDQVNAFRAMPDVKFNPEHAPLHSFPKGRVKPTGWNGFVFEGADSEGFLYTCRYCNSKVRVGEDVDPLTAHEPGCTGPF